MHFKWNFHLLSHINKTRFLFNVYACRFVRGNIARAFTNYICIMLVVFVFSFSVCHIYWLQLFHFYYSAHFILNVMHMDAFSYCVWIHAFNEMNVSNKFSWLLLNYTGDWNIKSYIMTILRLKPPRFHINTKTTTTNKTRKIKIKLKEKEEEEKKYTRGNAINISFISNGDEKLEKIPWKSTENKQLGFLLNFFFCIFCFI